MNDSAVFVGEIAVENGIFLNFEECEAVAERLEGKELTAETVSEAVREHFTVASGYVA